MNENRKSFFAAMRLMFGGLAQDQVDGTNYILDAWRAGPDTDLRWLAYALATTRHETNHTMQPVRELGGPAYFFKMYDPESKYEGRGAFSARNGARPGDGVLFYGRGFVQLTWRRNYARAGKELGLPLEANPDMAMSPDVAAKLLFRGMREGWFTGKKLGDYFKPGLADWSGARRIINGTDRAGTIAGYAQGFHRALLA